MSTQAVGWGSRTAVRRFGASKYGMHSECRLQHAYSAHNGMNLTWIDLLNQIPNKQSASRRGIRPTRHVFPSARPLVPRPIPYDSPVREDWISSDIRIIQNHFSASSGNAESQLTGAVVFPHPTVCIKKTDTVKKSRAYRLL